MRKENMKDKNMKEASFDQRINRVLGTNYLKRAEKEKFVFAAAVLILLAGEKAYDVLSLTFEAPRIEKVFTEEYNLTKAQIDFLFHDCLRITYRSGAHKISSIEREFKDDRDSLKEYVATFTEDRRITGAFSSSLNDLALKILATVDDKEETIVDYCSGSGVLLSQAFLQGVATKVCGEEIDPFQGELASLKLRALGCENAKIYVSDVLKEPKFLEQYNRIFSNFPIGQYKAEKGIFVKENYSGLAEVIDKEKRQEVFPDWQFINVLLNSLPQNGKAVAITTANRLSMRWDAPLRKRLIQDGKVEAVIFFGNGAFTNTNSSAAMLVLSNNNTAPKLIDARSFIAKKEKKQVLSEEDINKIFAMYLNGKKGDNQVFMPTEEDLQAHDYSLSIIDYVDPLEDLNMRNTVVLGDVATVQRGIMFASKLNEEKENKNCFLAKIACIEDGRIDNLVKINLDVLEKIKDKELLVGDVLLAAKGTQIKAAVVTKKYIMPVFADQNILVLRPKKDLLNSYYLSAFINSPLGEKIVKSAQAGDGMISISPNKARSLVIPVVEMDKQEKLAEAYSTATSEIEQLQKKLESKKQERANLVDDLLK